MSVYITGMRRRPTPTRMPTVPHGRTTAPHSGIFPLAYLKPLQSTTWEYRHLCVSQGPILLLNYVRLKPEDVTVGTVNGASQRYSHKAVLNPCIYRMSETLVTYRNDTQNSSGGDYSEGPHTPSTSPPRTHHARRLSLISCTIPDRHRGAHYRSTGRPLRICAPVFINMQGMGSPHPLPPLWHDSDRDKDSMERCSRLLPK